MRRVLLTLSFVFFLAGLTAAAQDVVQSANEPAEVQESENVESAQAAPAPEAEEEAQSEEAAPAEAPATNPEKKASREPSRPVAAFWFVIPTR